MKKIILSLLVFTLIATNAAGNNVADNELQKAEKKIEKLEKKVVRLTEKIDSLESLLNKNQKAVAKKITGLSRLYDELVKAYEELKEDKQQPEKAVFKARIVGDFNCGLAAARDGHKYGFVNKDSVFVVSAIYDEVYDFCNNYALVRAADKWGIVDETGRIVTPCRYVEVEQFGNDSQANIFRVKSEDGLYGIIKPGETVQKCDYEEIEQPVNGRANFCKKGRWGYFDDSGRIAISAKYKYPKMFNRGGTVTVTEAGTDRQVKIDLKGQVLQDYSKRK